MDYQAFDFLKFEVGMSYEKQDVSTPSTGVGEGYMDCWFWPIFNVNGDPLDVFSGNRNPIGKIINGGQNTNTFSNFRGNARAILDLSKWVTQGLKLSVNGNYKMARREYQEVKRPISFYDWSGQQVMGTFQSPGSLKEEIQRWENITVGAQVDYNRLFADVHQVSAMLGMTAEQETWKKVTAARNQGEIYPGAGLSDLEVWTNGDNNTAGGGQTSWGFVSYLTRLNYVYDDKYSIEFLGRRDGSSRLSEKQRWKNFFSVSGFWRISREKFLKDLDWLSDFKVRYNYGKTGSVTGIGEYERYALIKTGNTFFGRGDATQHTSMWLDGIRSDDRTWETILSHNAGVDLAFLNNRLRGSFDYFVKTNDNMFIPVTFPAVLGASAPLSNNGKLRTKGWELALNWRDQIGKVNYHVGFNISDARTYIDRYPNESKSLSTYYEGQELNDIWGYETHGIAKSQAEMDEWLAAGNRPSWGSGWTEGDIMYVDKNGDGVINTGANTLSDPGDQVKLGNSTPRFRFGLNLGLEWNNIDFSMFWQGVAKRDLWLDGPVFWGLNGGLWQSTGLEEHLDYYRPENTTSVFGPNTDAYFPRPYMDSDKNQQVQSRYMQNGAYMRLKNIQVGYTLPKQVLNKIGMEYLRFYVSAENIWTICSLPNGFDPETAYSGYTQNNSGKTYPLQATVSFGVNVTF